jgi:beta-N-acetylhexosaminidase
MKLNAVDAKWVEQTLATLTTRQKLGQIMIPRITAKGVEPYGFAGFVEKYQPGGGHMFGGDLETTHQVISEIQSASQIPMLITADLERGIGQRIEGSTEFAGQLALGACGDEDLAYRVGEAIAVEGTATGINWSFGPVVDLSLHPGNLSTIRCLGSEPEKVGRLACRIIEGMQSHGLAATAKHLPGAGTDDLDSHLTTSVNHQSREQWYRLSGLPFKMAIDAGVWTIMTSPKACPAIDPEAGDPLFPRPVMVSKSVCTGIIREEFGFDGLLVTDAVTMAGLTMHERRLPMHLACLNAGNDMLLFVRRLDSLYEYLERCLDDGSLSPARLDDAVRRVLTLKARLQLHKKPALMPLEEARKVFATTPYGKDAELLAEKSITLIRDRKHIVPLAARPGLRVLSVLITNRPDFTLDVFDQTLRDAGCIVTSVKNPEQETLYDRIEAGQWDAIVVSLYYPPQWGWSTSRCHGPESRCMMDGFPFANPNVPAVFISFSNPYHLHEFAFMDPYINTYGGCRGTQRATARALLGQLPFVGKSPVAHEPFFKLGDGLQRKARR